MSAPTVASLSFGTLGQIHLAIGEPVLTTGIGTNRLALPVKVAATWLDRETPGLNEPTLLTGTTWTDQPLFRWLATVQTQTLAVRGYQVSEELVIELLDDQIIALEQARGENDMVLRIKLQATLLRADVGIHPVAHEEVPIRISAGRWLELLDQLGSEVGIVVRVPSPLTDSALQPPPATSAEDAASLAQATARLRQARAELRDHQWEHCVATCRRVLENISRLVSLPKPSDVFNTKSESRNQTERWAAIYYDTKSLASAAHHDDTTTSEFTWNRVDAEATRITTAALLAHYTARHRTAGN